MKHVTASWSMSLHAECPHCLEDVDLLDWSEFWESTELEACETRTERSKKVEVTCPECDESFTIETEY